MQCNDRTWPGQRQRLLSQTDPAKLNEPTQLNLLKTMFVEQIPQSQSDPGNRQVLDGLKVQSLQSLQSVRSLQSLQSVQSVQSVQSAVEQDALVVGYRVMAVEHGKTGRSCNLSDDPLASKLRGGVDTANAGTGSGVLAVAGLQKHAALGDELIGW